jgi:hypothetical protein
VAVAGVSYDWLSSAGGHLYGVESAPEAGRAALVTWASGAVAVLRDGGVGSGWHAYGGTPYAILPSGDAAVIDGSAGVVTAPVWTWRR